MSAEQAAQVRELSDAVETASREFRDHKLRCLIPQCGVCADHGATVNDLMKALAMARANQEDDQ